MALSFEQLGTPDFDQGYVAFPVAAISGKVDIDNLKLHTPIQASQAIDSGRVLGDASAVYFPGRGIGAIDHQAVLRDGKHYEILPASKDAVDGKSRMIVDDGATILSLPNGLIRVVALAFTGEGAKWMNGRNYRTKDVVKVCKLGIEALDLEIEEISEETGIITAKPRIKNQRVSVIPRYKR